MIKTNYYLKKKEKVIRWRGTAFEKVLSWNESYASSMPYSEIAQFCPPKEKNSKGHVCSVETLLLLKGTPVLSHV